MENCSSSHFTELVFFQCSVDLKPVSTSGVLKRRGKVEFKMSSALLACSKGPAAFLSLFALWSNRKQGEKCFL